MWTEITGNLPDGHCVYVIREDDHNPDLLFAGTEFGVFASLDGGKSWSSLMNGLPVVAVHDLLIHPDAGDLIAGTNGLGVWILDDITPLQQLKDVKSSGDGAVLFKTREVSLQEGISRGGARGHQLFKGQNPPTVSQVGPSNSPTPLEHFALTHVFLEDVPKEEMFIRISALEGEGEITLPVEGKQGIQRLVWDLRFAPSERVLQIYKRSLERMLDHILGNAEAPQKKEIETMKKTLSKAKLAHELNRTRERIRGEFAPLITDRRFSVRPMRGPLTGPGSYRIELSTGGRTVISVK